MFTRTTLTVNYIDNQVVAFLNGKEVYNKTDQVSQQQFPDTVELTDKLKLGSNALLIVGINWGGPARFEGSLTIGDARTDWAEQIDIEKLGLIWSKLFDIQTAHIEPPRIEAVSSKSCPSVPAELRLETSPTSEVIKWKGLTYWTFTYNNNRDVTAIIAFDSFNKFAGRFEMGGARYVSKITIDHAFETITLHGQGGQTITFPWSGIG
jgi:hypothetical protein